MSVSSNGAEAQIMGDNRGCQFLLDHLPGVAGFPRKSTREVILLNQRLRRTLILPGSGGAENGGLLGMDFLKNVCFQVVFGHNVIKWSGR